MILYFDFAIKIFAQNFGVEFYKGKELPRLPQLTLSTFS